MRIRTFTKLIQHIFSLDEDQTPNSNVGHAPNCEQLMCCIDYYQTTFSTQMSEYVKQLLSMWARHKANFNEVLNDEAGDISED